MDQIPVALQAAVFLILGIAGIAYLVSVVRKTSHSETRELADTRGKRIDDLEDQVEDLKGKVERLRGSFEALQRIKAEEIAVEVARLLEPAIKGTG